MPSWNKGQSALRVYYLAHQFMDEFSIRWLPVSPDDLIDQRSNWHLKYVHELSFETGETEEHIIQHVMRSQDGLTIYDVRNDSYDIIINASDDIPSGRILWTKMHEIGHIYLEHLKKYEVTELRKDDMGEELYDQLEFEADLFAGEVTASKWLMRQMNITSEKDISEICGLSDRASQSRYRLATQDYSFIPANVIFMLHRFEVYLKEITVCADRDEMEHGIYAVNNPPHTKYAKPMAPFLRRPGICPYCGQKISPAALFCVSCGSPLKKDNLRSAGTTCGNRQSSQDAFCERCGKPVLRIRQGLCFEECEL